MRLAEAPEFLRERLDQTRFPADCHPHRAPFAPTSPLRRLELHQALLLVRLHPVPVAFQRCLLALHLLEYPLSRCRADPLTSAPRRIRTSDPRLRRPMLYPAELLVQCQHSLFASRIAAGSAYTKPRCALTRHFLYLAERAGFEPAVPLLAVHSLSKRAPSASRSPLLLRQNLLQTMNTLPIPAFPHSVDQNAVGHKRKESDCFALRCALRLSVPAEEEGFEPPALSRCGFQDRCLRPLGHSSKRRWTRLLSRACVTRK